MSRKILFRGKRKSDGEWIFGNLLQTDDDGTCIIQNHVPHHLLKNYVVDPGSIGQYTGLTDKNGKKIFEGDILSAHLDYQYPEDITYVQITWDGFSWCMRESTEDDVMTEYDCNIFEVCGNIFDNPELLNQ